MIFQFLNKQRIKRIRSSSPTIWILPDHSFCPGQVGNLLQTLHLVFLRMAPVTSGCFYRYQNTLHRIIRRPIRLRQVVDLSQALSLIFLWREWGIPVAPGCLHIWLGISFALCFCSISCFSRLCILSSVAWFVWGQGHVVRACLHSCRLVRGQSHAARAWLQAHGTGL